MQHFRHHIPRGSRASKYGAQANPDREPGRRTTFRDEREDPLEPEVLRYLQTVRVMDKTPSFVPMTEREARRFIQDPRNMQRVTELYARWYRVAPNQLDEPVFRPISLDETPTSEKPFAATSAEQICKEAIDTVARIRDVLVEKREELGQRKSALLELSRTNREMQEKLGSLVCANPSQIRDLNDRLAELLSMVRAVITDPHFVCALNGQRVPIVQREDTRKQVESARQRVRTKSEEINSVIEEFNRQVGVLSVEGQCHELIITDLYKKFSGFLVGLQIRHAQRKWIVDDFNVRLQRLILSFTERITRLQAERRTETDAYTDKKGALDAYDRNTRTIQALNESISTLNSAIEQLKTRIERLKKTLAQESKNGRGVALQETNGDTKDPSVKLKVLTQCDAVGKAYSKRFEDLDGVLNRALTEIEQLEKQCATVIDLCTTTERIIRAVRPQLCIIPIREVTASGLSITAIADRTRELAHTIGESDTNLVALAASHWEPPQHIHFLRSLVIKFGGANERALMDAASEVLEERRVLSDQTRTAHLQRETIVEAIRILDRQTRTSGLRSDERLLVQKLRDVTSNPALRTALTAYVAGLECRAVELDLFEVAMNQIIYGPKETRVIEGHRLSSLDFTGRSIEILRMSIPIIGRRLIEQGDSLDDHAFKHVGWVSHHCVRTDVVPDQEEALLWSKLRDGTSDYSAQALGLARNSYLARAHYAEVISTIARTATPFVSVFLDKDHSFKASPTLFFVSDLSSRGFPDLAVYVAFEYSLTGGEIGWTSTYITTKERLLNRGSIRFITPISRKTLFEA